MNRRSFRPRCRQRSLRRLGAEGGEPPEVGAKAPGFTLQGSDGSSYSLSQFVGERGVVLAWFPKASTPG